MKLNSGFTARFAGLALGVVTVVALPVLYAADAAKISDVIAGNELANAAETIVKALEPKVSSATNLKQAADEVEQKAYVLALLANGVAANGEGVAWKASATQVRDAALKLAKSKVHTQASEQIDVIKTAMGGGTQKSGEAANWDQFVPLKYVMKEVQELRRPIAKNTRGTALSRTKDDVARDASLWAFYGFVARHDTQTAKRAKKPQADFEKWADEFVAGSRELAIAAKKGDAAAVKAAVNRANKACTDCHEVFRPDVTDTP